MKLRSREALRFGSMYLPIYLGLGGACYLLFDVLPWPNKNWPDFLFKAAASTILFSLIMTAYRKPK